VHSQKKMMMERGKKMRETALFFIGNRKILDNAMKMA
jgi:hypothetical protein